MNININKKVLEKVAFYSMITIAASAAIIVSVIATSSRAVTKPNFVVIMTDDLDVGLMNEMLAAGLLPNIKKYLTDVGYTFAQHFTTNSVCCPSRASFFTGQYPHNNKVFSNGPPDGGVVAFNNSSTLATWLKTVGYKNSLVGKYLNLYGWLTPGTEIPPGWGDWQASLDPGAYTSYKYKINDNGTIIDHTQYGEQAWNYQTDMLSLRAGRFLSQVSATQPFFEYIAPINPHFVDYNVCPSPITPENPLSGNVYGTTIRPPQRYKNTLAGNPTYTLPKPPSFNEANVSDKPGFIQGIPSMTAEDMDCIQKQHWSRMEAMRAVDDMVAYIISTLQTRGLLSNTVVIFTSDNGYMRGEHRLTEKEVAYEEAIRVPLIIRTPWNSTPKTIRKITLNIDLAPTIAQWAGATPTLTVDGRSLVPFTQTTEPPYWRKMFMVEHKITQIPEVPGYVPKPDYFALRVESPVPLLFVEYPALASSSIGGELYDLVKDPYEINNQYASSSTVVTNIKNGLRPWLNAMKTCSGTICQALEALFPTGTL